ncbi:hypothetical protein RUND412_011242 [Rhizina undulata]
MSTVSDADTRAADIETVEKRYNLVVKIESWEVLAMHSIAGEESIPRVRLRMLKTLAGVEDSCSPPSSPSSSRARGSKERT